MNIESLISRPAVHADERGKVYEIMHGISSASGGQIFITTAYPGRSKGHHFHRRKTEWFCVVSGRGEMKLREIETGDTATIPMTFDDPIIIKIVPGLAHALINTGTETLTAVVISSEIFNPDDADTYLETVD